MSFIDSGLNVEICTASLASSGVKKRFNRRISAPDSVAGKLTGGPTKAIGLTKRAMNRALVSSLDEALDYEAKLQEIAGRTEDHREGVAAFLEKRRPEFKGR